MKRKSWIIAGAAAVAGVTVLAWAFAPKPLEVEAATAAPGHFETAISEDGMTRLRDSYRVTAPLSGQLRRITLREGDAVASGAVVATIEPALAPMLDARTLREQQARVDMALAQVQQANAHVAATEVAQQRARDELARGEQLASKGFIAAGKLSDARLALQGAQKEGEMAQAARRIAVHEVTLARAALAAVTAPGGKAREFALRSPIAGRVLRLVQTSESFVTPGTPLLELGDVANLEVVADVLTADAAQARPGSMVAIERWGGPVLAGRVRLIEPAAFTKVSVLGVEEQRVKVIVEIASAPAEWTRLGVGYRVGVRIITQAQDNALKVPVSAVFPLPEGGMAVFVIEDGKARLRKVGLGGRSDREAWIREGLAKGARVIVYPPTALQDGSRVQVRGV